MANIATRPTLLTCARSRHVLIGCSILVDAPVHRAAMCRCGAEIARAASQLSIASARELHCDEPACPAQTHLEDLGATLRLLLWTQRAFDCGCVPTDRRVQRYLEQHVYRVCGAV